MKSVSLLVRLVWSVIGVTALVYLLSALVLYEALEISSEKTLKQALDRQLELVKGLLEEEDNGRIIELELDDLKTGEFVELYSGRYYIVLISGQEPILSASLGGAMPAFMAKIPRQQFDPQQQLLRGPLGEELMTISQTLHFARREILVVVAESLAETKDWLRQIQMALLIGIPLALLLLFGLIWLVVRLALVPLTGLIDDIHAFDFQAETTLPLRKGRPVSELQQLAGAFNGLLERIQQVRKAEEQLLLEVSHQLKTPVTVILSTCDVMLQRERTLPVYQNALEQIRDTGRSMRTLLMRLLSAAHLESAGRRNLVLTPLELDAVVTQAIMMMEPFAHKKSITLVQQMHLKQQVLGNQTRLIELLIILLENAIHYSPAGTTVHIITLSKEQQAWVSVQDQGPGILADDLPHLFTRFFRGHNAEGSEGSGLGLTIAQQIAHQHHGEIKVQSETGQGACFTLSLPMVTERPEAPITATNMPS